MNLQTQYPFSLAMPIFYVLLLIVYIRISSAECTCTAPTTSCSNIVNDCTGYLDCDVVLITSSEFILKQECLNGFNNGKVPIFKCYQQECSLFLDSNVFENDGGLMIDYSKVYLSGFVNFELFKTFQLTDYNSFLVVNGPHEMKDSIFNTKQGSIQFLKEASIINSTFAFHGNKLIYEGSGLKIDKSNFITNSFESTSQTISFIRSSLIFNCPFIIGKRFISDVKFDGSNLTSDFITSSNIAYFEGGYLTITDSYFDIKSYLLQIYTTKIGVYNSLLNYNGNYLDFGIHGTSSVLFRNSEIKINSTNDTYLRFNFQTFENSSLIVESSKKFTLSPNENSFILNNSVFKVLDTILFVSNTSIDSSNSYIQLESKNSIFDIGSRFESSEIQVNSATISFVKESTFVKSTLFINNSTFYSEDSINFERDSKLIYEGVCFNQFKSRYLFAKESIVEIKDGSNVSVENENYGLMFGIGNSVIIHDNTTISFFEMALELNKNSVGNGNNIFALHLFISDFPVKESVLSQISIRNTHYYLFGNMNLTNGLNKYSITTSLDLYDNSHLILDEGSLLATFFDVNIKDNAVLTVKLNLFNCEKKLKLQNNGQIEFIDSGSYIAQSVDLFDFSRFYFETNSSFESIYFVSKHNSVAYFNKALTVSIANSYILDDNGSLIISDCAKVFVNALKSSGNATVDLFNTTSLQVNSLLQYMNSLVFIKQSEFINVSTLISFNTSRITFQCVSNFYSNIQVSNNSILKVIKTNIFYGDTYAKDNSTVIFDNCAFQQVTKRVQTTTMYSHSQLIFLGRNSIGVVRFELNFDGQNKLILEDDTLILKGKIYLYSNENSKIEIGNNCSVGFDKIYFHNNTNNMTIGVNSLVDVVHLSQYNVREEHKLKYFKYSNLCLSGKSSLSIDSNLTLGQIETSGTSNLTFNNCHIYCDRLFMDIHSSFIFNNSTLTTGSINYFSYGPVKRLGYHFELLGESKIDSKVINVTNLYLSFFLDSEAHLFFGNSQADTIYLLFDLGNNPRKSQVMDIGFAISVISYFEITSNLEQCVDIIYSSISTYRIYWENYFLLSNGRVLRSCPKADEVDNRFICTLNGSIWQNQYTEHNFSFTTRNCPCNGDDFTNCYFLPTTTSLEMPTSEEFLNFSGPLENLYVNKERRPITMVGTFLKVIMPSYLELTLPFQKTKSDLPNGFVAFSTIFTESDYLSYFANSNSGQEAINVVMNNVKDEEIILRTKFGILNFDYIHEIIYTLINSPEALKIVKKYTLRTIEGFTTNFISYTDSTVFISKSGFVNKEKNTSCNAFLDKTYFSSNCLFEETPWCPSGQFFWGEVQSCHSCSENCRRCINSSYCIKCNSGHVLTTEGDCKEKTRNCQQQNEGECRLCNYGYYYNETKCELCPLDCLHCNSTYCFICPFGFINQNGSCMKNSNVEYASNENIIQCQSQYYLKHSLNLPEKCEQCSLTITNCEICENDLKCVKCKTNFTFDHNKTCVSNECTQGYKKNEYGYCVEEKENCIEYRGDGCFVCESDYHTQGGVCIPNSNSNCLKFKSNKCFKCSNHFYLSEGICKECSDNCRECANSPEYCLSCYEGTFLDVNTKKCSTTEGMKDKCSLYSATGNCVRCKEGYYRNGYSCIKCAEECSSCQNNDTCVACSDDYFMNYVNQCQLKSTIIGCETNISISLGCTKCKGGYYLYRKECYECDNKCKTCLYSSDYCTSCFDNKVLITKQCFEMGLIERCTETENSKCVKCSFWYSPNEEGTQCNKKAVWWLLLIISLVLAISFILITVVTTKLINHFLKRKQRKEQEKTICVFEMERSNVQFANKICEEVYSNVYKIDFNEDEPQISVDEETKSLICIGNKGKTSKKIQITLKEGCDKYSIRTNPQLITLTKGEACEFEIFITPLCTSKFEDNLNIVVLDMKKSKTLINQMKILVKTKISTKIDPDELIEEKKIGEGSFGIVYLGSFRGNKVAIKKMKQLNVEQKSTEEFSNEVSMLDKFRSEYIVHFYGAVFIPNKICMVTEFAQFGSLQDLMKKEQLNQPRLLVRIKLMIDSAKGIQYLHSNGILHRDIKPDNILVMSLDENENVNAKLTDFGASRNVNMLMTNMTFTKGIGTPKYMAPEILNRQKYKMPSDIYSFAITMYECFGWCEIYPKTDFQKPWAIADFVANGKRRPSLENIPNELNEIIKESWKQNPKERIRIEDIIQLLQQLSFNL